MFRDWTFGQKIGTAFAVTVVLSLLIGGCAVWALRTVVRSKDAVIADDARALIDAQRLALHAARKSGAQRGFLLAQKERYLDEMNEQRARYFSILDHMRDQLVDAESKTLLDEAERTARAHDASADRLLELSRAQATDEAIEQAFETDVSPLRDKLAASLDAFASYRERVMQQDTAASTQIATSATNLTAGLVAAITLIALAIGVVLVRTLSRQIGTVVVQVQSSSAELQAAANQQATASKEQSTAMTEISTTITELLATSRQIAESAQRVTRVAEQTAESARSGDATVDRAHQSITGIRRQVDLIVSHMLDLGKKSQQIGAVLEIVSELAEQTNILAINATIEAVGAGETGKRFGVVADEIRKLADRVGGSTKEIRALIEDVRNSVNATVMTTETGSKAVDAGTKQFNEVATALKQIAGQVLTTTEVAREIGLSTKQQATAVEQVNVAITSVAQASRETEASSGQTLTTAGQLHSLSRGLLRIVQRENQPHSAHHGV